MQPFVPVIEHAEPLQPFSSVHSVSLGLRSVMQPSLCISKTLHRPRRSPWPRAQSFPTPAPSPWQQLVLLLDRSCEGDPAAHGLSGLASALTVLFAMLHQLPLLRACPW